MPSSFFENYLKDHPSIDCQDGLYYQKTLEKTLPFENHYTSLREKEGRLYNDGVVEKLPFIASDHPLSDEWLVRKHSADRLIRFLKTKNPRTVLEVGCGNGWLIHYIHNAIHTGCCGVDVNEIELKQAVNVFGGTKNLSFLYADIHSGIFVKPSIDIIILASVIQYFPNPQSLLHSLIKMLAPGGQIHILDSPFYRDEEIESARQRSEEYFRRSGEPGMQFHYFHHSWRVLNGFSYTLRNNPVSYWSRLLRKVTGGSPFPWLIIENQLLEQASKRT
jgi:SAM-dependent methyltransferase